MWHRVVSRIDIVVTITNRKFMVVLRVNPCNERIYFMKKQKNLINRWFLSIYERKIRRL